MRDNPYKNPYKRTRRYSRGVKWATAVGDTIHVPNPKLLRKILREVDKTSGPTTTQVTISLGLLALLFYTLFDLLK